MGAGAQENRGECAVVVQEAGEKRGWEVEVLKRREDGEITQCLIFRSRKRAKEGKRGKKGWKPGMHGMGGRSFLPLFPPFTLPPPRTMDSISNFESVHVCFGGRILTQFLAHPCNREVKSLSHIVMVAKFLNLDNSWSCKHGRKRKRKN